MTNIHENDLAHSLTNNVNIIQSHPPTMKYSTQCRRQSLVVWLLLLCCLLNVQWTTASAHKPNQAAIPRSKHGKKGLSSIFGNKFISNVIREAKISFCSELEGLALQVTKPSNVAIPLNLLEELINFVDLEYDNPELIVSILVKLSRKFSESHVITQMKALLALHVVMQKIEDKAKTAWSKAIASMREEDDEKVKMTFFSLQAIEEAATSTSTVLELQTLEFNRIYAHYFFDYLAIRGEKATSKNAMCPSDKASLILRLIEESDALESLCNQMDTALSLQVLDALRVDRSWYVKTLTKMYEGNAFDDDRGLEKDVEKALKRLDSKFKPVVRPMIEMDGQEEEFEEHEDDSEQIDFSSVEVDANDEDGSGSGHDIPVALRKAVKESINKSSSTDNKKKTSKKTAVKGKGKNTTK